MLVVPPQAAARPHSCRRDRDRARAPELRLQARLPPSPGHPGLTVSSHNRLPGRAAPVLKAHGVRNAGALPERRVPVWRAPLQGSHPGVGQRFLPAWGHAPSDNQFPLNSAGTCTSAHIPRALEGTEPDSC